MRMHAAESHGQRVGEHVHLLPHFGLLVLVALLVPAFAYDLALPDEPRVAHTSLEVVRTGEWTVPSRNGRPFLQTPPLYYWLLGGFFHLTGWIQDGAARVPSALCTAGTLWLMFAFGRRWAGAHAGLLGALAALGMFQFWDIGHRVVVEPLLTLLCTAAFYELACILVDGDFRWQRGLRLGLWTGGAFLAKGIVGPVYVGTVATIVTAWMRTHSAAEIRRGLTRPVLGALAGFALVTLPWAGTLWSREPEYLTEIVIGTVLLRVEGSVAVHNPPFWTFFHRVLLNFMPWTAVAPWVLWRLFPRRSGKRATAEERYRGLLIAWFLAPLILLFLSPSKRNLYLLPTIPALALLVGIWLDALPTHRWYRPTLRVLLYLLVVGAIAGAGAASWIYPTVAGASLTVVGALAVLVSLVLLWRRRSADGIHRIQLGAATLIVLALTVTMWGTFVHGVRNPRSTAAPLGRELQALAAAGHSILGFRLSEREEGAVAWYLRRAFPMEVEVEDLARQVREGASRLKSKITIVAERTSVDELREHPSFQGLPLTVGPEEWRLRRRRLKLLAVGGD